jgi:hypothetical protein
MNTNSVARTLDSTRIIIVARTDVEVVGTETWGMALGFMSWAVGIMSDRALS